MLIEVVQTGVAGIFGLLIGSFLNVVVYRLPKMLERQWAAEYAEFAGQSVQPDATFNLMLPKSHCQHCGHQIRWYENIPILSYLFLRAKCSSCQAPISARYPLVELSVGLLFTFCISKWGVTPTGFAWCGFSAALVTLSLIDWDTTLLPDDITLPLLWAGLILSATKVIPVPLSSSLWGAVAGYLSLWLIYWAFKLITGKEGMGYGDFKLFAALGAWFGWTALIPVILMASVVGALIGLVLQFTSQLREGGYVPFGPFLGAAGLCVMMVGSETLFKIIGIASI